MGATVSRTEKVMRSNRWDEEMRNGKFLPGAKMTAVGGATRNLLKRVGLLSAGLVALSLAACRKEEPGFEVPTARLEIEEYDFSVAYPDTLDVREYIPERTSIGFAMGDGFDARTEIALDSDSTLTYEALVEQATLNSCYADGPGISLRCIDIERRGTVRAETREEGEIFYMTMEVTEDGRVTDTMPRGPYVAFDLSSRRGTPTVLFVRAPATRQLWETDVDLVLNIARSLRIED